MCILKRVRLPDCEADAFENPRSGSFTVVNGCELVTSPQVFGAVSHAQLRQVLAVELYFDTVGVRIRVELNELNTRASEMHLCRCASKRQATFLNLELRFAKHRTHR